MFGLGGKAWETTVGVMAYMFLCVKLLESKYKFKSLSLVSQILLHDYVIIISMLYRPPRGYRPPDFR